MSNRFLTKKTKITIKEEKETIGLRTALGARTKSGEFNKEATTDFEKRMSVNKIWHSNYGKNILSCISEKSEMFSRFERESQLKLGVHQQSNLFMQK